MDGKSLEKINPCWKCGKDPIIVITKNKSFLKCPNEECNNSIVLTDYPTIEDGFDIWNKVYNCEPFIPENAHYLNTCNKCIHKMNCILARSLDNIHLLSISCDKFERNKNKEFIEIKLKSYMESIYHKR